MSVYSSGYLSKIAKDAGNDLKQSAARQNCKAKVEPGYEIRITDTSTCLTV